MMDEEKYKRILKIYYLMTPAFMLLDYGAGLKLRIVFPAEIGSYTILYYAICFIGGFFAFKQTLIAALFCLFESSINILLLLLSIFLPVLSPGQGDGDSPGYSFGGMDLIHFFIVGAVLLFGFYQNPLVSRGQV